MTVQQWENAVRLDLPAAMAGDGQAAGRLYELATSPPPSMADAELREVAASLTDAELACLSQLRTAQAIGPRLRIVDGE